MRGKRDTFVFYFRGKVTRQCPQTPAFEEKGEPKRGMEPTPSAYQPDALPLGHSGSLDQGLSILKYTDGPDLAYN